MKCQYFGCPNEAIFVCLCEGEGETERRPLCHHHTLKGVEICELFGWQLTVTRIAATEALPS